MRKKNKWSCKKKAIRNLLVAAIARKDCNAVNRYQEMFDNCDKED